MSRPQFEDRLHAMFSAQPESSLDYFALTVLGGTDGRATHSVFTHWVKFSDKTNRFEVREASIVKAERVVQTWREIGEDAAVVNTTEDLLLYFSVGGHAVVEEQVARNVIPTWFAPSISAAEGAMGFVAIDALPDGSLFRAPRPKQRMRILKRDNFKCRVCGRDPNNHTDLELHVHHVRPWGLGGVTIDENLITLCHTCHNGLEPHFEPALFEILNPFQGTAAEERRRREYAEGVNSYRRQLIVSSIKLK